MLQFLLIESIIFYVQILRTGTISRNNLLYWIFEILWRMTRRAGYANTTQKKGSEFHSENLKELEYLGFSSRWKDNIKMYLTGYRV